ncbi:hypothetical protein TorRG33x02_352190, partial [Trema orientale]
KQERVPNTPYFLFLPSELFFSSSVTILPSSCDFPPTDKKPPRSLSLMCLRCGRAHAVFLTIDAALILQSWQSNRNHRRRPVLSPLSY